MNEVFLLWGFGLFGLALLLFLVELFLPTGGILGVMVGVAAIAGVVSFFRASQVWGWSSLGFLIVVSPFAFAFALKVWPHTPIGRRLILGSVEDEVDEEAPQVRDEEGDVLKALIGATGEAVSDLRPVGTVRIEGERVEALAESGMIDAGQKVRITAVEGNRIRVRAVK